MMQVKRCLYLSIFLLILIAGCTGVPREGSYQQAWRFAVMNDSRGDNQNVSGKSCINDKVLALIARDIAKEKPEFLLVAGDLVNGFHQNGGTAFATQFSNWKSAMAPVYGAGIPVYPIRGNHENGPEQNRNWPWPPKQPILGPAVIEDITKAFIKAFPEGYIPENGPIGEVRLTYSFVHKNALIVGLDQYVDHPHRVNQEWFKEQLTQSALSGRHLFVYGHEPAFEVRHRDALSYYPKERDEFWDSIGGAGGRVYFCGHDHLYNRAEISDSAGNSIQQVVVGTGGAPLVAWPGTYVEGNKVNGKSADSRHFGYMLVTVDGPKATVIFKAFPQDATEPVAWRVLDSFSYTLSGSNN